MSRKQKIVLAVLGGLFACGLAVGLMALIFSPGESSQSACINNLRQIDSAKQVWAFANHKAKGDAVSWHDIQQYCGRGGSVDMPKCPDGGTYTIGRVGEPPTCSVAGHTMD